MGSRRLLVGVVGLGLALTSRVARAQNDVPPPPDSPPPPPAPPDSPPSAPPQYAAPQGEYAPAPPIPAYSEPPLPPAPDDESGDGKFHMPPFSIRVDPFTWLIEGRLGFELEAGITKWMTAELVPVFVTTSSPPALSSFDERDSGVRQASNGLGPLSGTSLGLGFWLGGHAFHGVVLRAIFTNYGYTYKGYDESGAQVDQLSHTDRWLMGMVGSHSTWGVFTLAYDFGLGVDLNHQTRCFARDAISTADVSSNGCSGLEIATEKDVSQIADVAPSFYPVVVAGRFSLGVTFE
jgi:hypothetical protein